MNDKKIKVTISLSEGILLDIDKQARLQGLSRSAYISKLQADENRRNREFMEQFPAPTFMSGFGK